MVKQILDITSEKVFSIRNFRVLIIVTTMIMMVPYFHFYFGVYVKYVLLFGIVALLFQLCRSRFSDVFNDNTGRVLLLFSLSYLITILINSNINLVSNIKAWVYMIVFFMLLYIKNDLTLQQIKTEFKIISKLIVFVTFCFSAICLFTYLIGLENAYMLADPKCVYHLGIYDGRLWGLYNPNTGSMLSVISIILCGYLFGTTIESDKSNTKKGLSLIFFTANIIVQFISLTLTASRTAYYGLLIVTPIIIFLVSLHRNDTKGIKRVVKCGLITLLLILIMLICNKGVYSVMPNVKEMFSQNFNCSMLQEMFLEIMPQNPWLQDTADTEKSFAALLEEKENQTITLQEKDYSDVDVYEREDIDNAGSLSGRDLLWRAGIEIFKENWLLGTSRENLYEYVRHPLVAMPGGYSLETDLRIGGLHNMYLTILVSSGVVGFSLFIIFGILVLKDVCLQIYKQRKLSLEFAFSVVIVLLFLITELTEARILFQVNTFNVMFWLFLGYVRTCCKQNDTI